MGVTIGAKESKSLPDQSQVTSYTTTQVQDRQSQRKIPRKKLNTRTNRDKENTKSKESKLLPAPPK